MHEGTRSEIERLLPARLDRLRRTSGLPVAFGGVVRGYPALGLEISSLAGTITADLAGLAVPAGRGLGGSVVATSRPQRVNRYAAATEITHDFDRIVVDQERLTSVVAAPIIVDNEVFGVLYAAVRGVDGIGDSALRSAQIVAAHLARDAAGPTRHDKQAAVSAVLEELERIKLIAPDNIRERLTRVTRILHAEQSLGSGLSQRESEVLACVGSGATNFEIAAELGLRPETVKAYLRSAMARLGVHSRTAAAIAYQFHT